MKTATDILWIVVIGSLMGWILAGAAGLVP